MPAEAPAANEAASLEGRAAAILARSEDLAALMRLVRDHGPPQAWIVSGAIYGTIWNALTGRPARHGLKDYDVVYHDGRDLSWEAEDREIRRFAAVAAPLGLPVELRNQARVHLWFPARFGVAYPRLGSVLESLNYYASTAHAVAARLGPAGVEVAAPFGLADVFAMRVRPNRALDNRATHEEKAARIKARWPEARIEPW